MNPVYIFYLFEFVAAAAAVGLLFTRNVFYGVLMLVTCLLAIAGIYVLAFAELVAVTQILVYAGGIVVLIIFGVMLTSRISGKPIVSANRNWVLGVIPGIIIFSTLVVLFGDVSTETSAIPHTESITRQLGVLFMTDYLSQFELAGILLLITLVAAAVTVSRANLKDEA